MMLWSPRTRGGAGHHPHSAARGVAALTTELIVETGRIVARDLTRDSASRARGLPLPGSIRMPAKTARSGARIQTIVAPAVAQIAQPKGIDARGPLPADTHVPCRRPRQL